MHPIFCMLVTIDEVLFIFDTPVTTSANRSVGQLFLEDCKYTQKTGRLLSSLQAPDKLQDRGKLDFHVGLSTDVLRKAAESSPRATVRGKFRIRDQKPPHHLSHSQEVPLSTPQWIPPSECAGRSHSATRGGSVRTFRSSPFVPPITHPARLRPGSIWALAFLAAAVNRSARAKEELSSCRPFQQTAARSEQ